MRFYFVLAFYILVSSNVCAQTVLYWDCVTATPTSGSHPNIAASPTWSQQNNNGTTALITTTSASNYTGASGTSNFGAATFTGTLTSNSTYFQVSITVNNPGALKLTAFSFGSRSTSTGPQAYVLRSVINGTEADIVSGTLSNSSSWNQYTHAGINVPASGSVPSTTPQTVLYRLYGHSGTGNPTAGTANWRIDDIRMTFDDAVLPVTFTSFSATKDGKNNLLSWATASEQNNAGFEVQRSTDGSTYEKIGFVKSLSATGNSSSSLSYSFTDFNPLGLQQYYRLKQTDLDGKSAYSAIVLVKREAPATLTVTKVYPNPSTSSIYINAACPAATTLQLSIVDMNGRVVGRKQVNAMTGNNGFDMPVTQLAPGTYLLQVLNADSKVVTTEKFIKQ